jgi:Uma2 family endonuclease
MRFLISGFRDWPTARGENVRVTSRGAIEFCGEDCHSAAARLTLNAAMLTILEQSSVRRAAAPISVEAYHALGEAGLIPERVELLKGVIVEKMSKSPLHASVVRYLVKLLENCVGTGFLVLKEDPLTLRDSEPEPDIAVVRGTPEDYQYAHPTTAELVIEVALSSGEIDREKVSIYAAASVRECWLVLPEFARLEVYTQPVGNDYVNKRIYTSGDAVRSEAVAGFQVELSQLFRA